MEDHFPSLIHTKKMSQSLVQPPIKHMKATSIALLLLTSFTGLADETTPTVKKADKTINQPTTIIANTILRIKTPYNSNHSPTQRDTLYQVDDDGSIQLGKGLGSLKVKGLTRKGVLDLLAKNYVGYNYTRTGMNSLEVAIIPHHTSTLKKQNKAIITGYLKKTFFPIPAKEGGFYSPAISEVKCIEIAVDAETSLKAAFDLAGGSTAFASTNRIEFLRDGKKFKVNLKTQADFKVLSGDVILVPAKRMLSR